MESVMPVLPDGRLQITNKRTGETKIINPQEAGKYGVFQPDNTNPLQKVGKFLENNAPLIGGIAAPIALTLASGGTAAPATIPMLMAAFAGGAGGKLLQGTSRQIRGEEQIEPGLGGFARNQSGFVGSGVQQAANEAMGQGINKIGGAILGPIFSKTGGITPNQIKTNVSNLGSDLWKPVQKYIEGNSNQGIPVGDVIKSLEGLVSGRYDDIASREAANASSKIAKDVISPLADSVKKVGGKKSVTTIANDVLEPGQVQKLKTMFNAGSYTPKGGFKTPTTEASKATLSAKKLAAGKLDNKMKEFLAGGGQDLVNNYENYGQTKAITSALDQPFQSSLGQLPAIISALGFLTGNPMVGAGGLGATALSMPYTRMLLQQILGRGVQSSKIPAEILVNELMNNETE